MFLIGYLSMLAVGLTIGLIGAGGAILTVPIMVYLFDVPALLATSYSLFIVGTSSVFGLIRYHRDRLIDYHTATVFALPSIVGTYVTRRGLLPLIPDKILISHLAIINKDQIILTVFAMVMLAASLSMIRGHAPNPPQSGRAANRLRLGGLGFVVGAVAGFIGAGGGFLIIPALVLVVGMPMAMAVGTSLLIVAANSLIGFTGDVLAAVPMEWFFLLKVTGVALLGIVFGIHVSKRVEPSQLKKVFGWFVLANGCYILIRQILATGAANGG